MYHIIIKYICIIILSNTGLINSIILPPTSHCVEERPRKRRQKVKKKKEKVASSFLKAIVPII
jgi:hypothetical protein